MNYLDEVLVRIPICQFDLTLCKDLVVTRGNLLVGGVLIVGVIVFYVGLKLIVRLVK